MFHKVLNTRCIRDQRVNYYDEGRKVKLFAAKYSSFFSRKHQIFNNRIQKLITLL